MDAREEVCSSAMVRSRAAIGERRHGSGGSHKRCVVFIQGEAGTHRRDFGHCFQRGLRRAAGGMACSVALAVRAPRAAGEP